MEFIEARLAELAGLENALHLGRKATLQRRFEEDSARHQQREQEDSTWSQGLDSINQEEDVSR